MPVRVKIAALRGSQLARVNQERLQVAQEELCRPTKGADHVDTNVGHQRRGRVPNIRDILPKLGLVPRRVTKESWRVGMNNEGTLYLSVTARRGRLRPAVLQVKQAIGCCPKLSRLF